MWNELENWANPKLFVIRRAFGNKVVIISILLVYHLHHFRCCCCCHYDEKILCMLLIIHVNPTFIFHCLASVVVKMNVFSEQSTFQCENLLSQRCRNFHINLSFRCCRWPNSRISLSAWLVGVDQLSNFIICVQNK